MGEPHLERLTMSFAVQDKATDEQSVDFGFREITSELTANGSRLFRVNGKRILIRGGGWSQDMLLRTDENRLRDQFRMVRDLNLNTIRLEGKLETDEFFHLADQQGILVMLGWCCCDHWEHWKDWTADDLTIATASLRAQMLRLRHHASLLVWLNGSDNPPPANVESAYLKVESETHWPNPVLSSASATPTTVTGESGVKMSGPYDYVAPSYWYVDTAHGGAFGFNTETSPGPAIPSLASRQKFLPDPEAWPPVRKLELSRRQRRIRQPQSLRPGHGSHLRQATIHPTNMNAWRGPWSTIPSAPCSRPIRKNKYTSTGVVQWMLNNAWPSMIWHLYDYYLDAGGGYFGTKKACEPLHIQYSYDDGSIAVINSRYEKLTGLTATATLYDLDLKQRFTKKQSLDLEADSVAKPFSIPADAFTPASRCLLPEARLHRRRRQSSRPEFLLALERQEPVRLEEDHVPVHAGHALR